MSEIRNCTDSTERMIEEACRDVERWIAAVTTNGSVSGTAAAACRQIIRSLAYVIGKEPSGETILPYAIGKEAAAPVSVSLTEREHVTLKNLISLADAIDHALHDAEEAERGEAMLSAEHTNMLNCGIACLEDLPDDKPGYTLCGPAKAKWALRRLTKAQIATEAAILPAPAKRSEDQSQAVRIALQELVRLKDLKEWLERVGCGAAGTATAAAKAQYEREKEPAWEAARLALEAAYEVTLARDRLKGAAGG